MVAGLDVSVEVMDKGLFSRRNAIGMSFTGLPKMDEIS
jgi:hypothetical protein